jgi:hypothetical protein
MIQRCIKARYSMVRTNKLHLALMNLNGEVSSDIVFGYFEKNTALEILRKITGEDFGYDVEAWRAWIKQNRPGTLPEETRKPTYPPYLRHLLDKKGNLENPLEIAYRDYLAEELSKTSAETLADVLVQCGLETESYCLRTYLASGRDSNVDCRIGLWGKRRCTISLDLPEEAEAGDLWFDPVELNLSVLVPNPEGISHHVRSWVSTHPVYTWQYRAFLNLAELGNHLDVGKTPPDYLNPERFNSQNSLSFVVNLYQDEAVAYSSWMRKSLCGRNNLKAMSKYLDSTQLGNILPNKLKLWTNEEFQEDYRVAIGYSSLDKNPSLDYDDIVAENHEDLESKSDRMLYEEWDCFNNIGMLTIVPVFIGLDQEDRAESLHYQFLNISPRPVQGSVV